MDDRTRIFDFIEQNDPRTAIAVDDRIARQVRVLIRFPEGGRPGRSNQFLLREWVNAASA